MSPLPRPAVVLTAVIALMASACSPEPPTSGMEHHDHEHASHGPDPAHHHHDPEQHHAPPHGGTAVAMGGGKFHIEFVFDAGNGDGDRAFRAYVLDDHMHEFVRLPLNAFIVTARLDGETSDRTLRFEAFLPEGDTPAIAGGSAVFRAPADGLPEQPAFTGTLGPLVVEGSDYGGVTFRFPDGNDPHLPVVH